MENLALVIKGCIIFSDSSLVSFGIEMLILLPSMFIVNSSSLIELNLFSRMDLVESIASLVIGITCFVIGSIFGSTMSVMAASWLSIIRSLTNLDILLRVKKAYKAMNPSKMTVRLRELLDRMRFGMK